MVDVASLVVKVDTRQVVAGEEALDGLAQTGRRVETQFDGIGTSSTRAASGLNKTTSHARGVGLGFQNAALQIGDFAVQVGAGSNAATALAQQLPQLLGGFGLFGILAGAAAAILIPLARAFFSSGEAAVSFSDALDTANEATANLKKHTKETADDLVEKYGAMTAAIVALQQDLLKLDLGEQAKSSAELLKAALLELAPTADLVDRAMSNLSEDALTLGISQTELFQGRLEATAQAAGMTSAQLLGIDTAIQKLADAQGIEKQAEAASELQTALENANATSFSTVISNLVALRDSLFQSAEAARDADTAIKALADPYADLRAMDDERGSQRLGDQSIGEWRLQEAQQNAKEIARGIHTGGGGGGGAAAYNRDMLEAQKIYESTRTSAEKYAAELAHLDELYQAGLIDTETYNRALAGLEGQFAATGKTAGEEFAAMLDSAGRGVDSIHSLKDAVKDLGAEFLRLSATGFLQGLFGLSSAPTSGIGGFFASMASGLFKAEGGPVRGGNPYIVGERGPELFVPSVSGSIVPNGGSMGGGGNVTLHQTVQISSDVDPAKINVLIARAVPAITRATLSALPDKMQRGGGYASAVRGY